MAFYPVRSITSAVVCDVLEHKYFMNYGVPKSLVSDNAKVFKSKLFYDFCFQWGIKEDKYYALLSSGFSGRASHA